MELYVVYVGEPLDRATVGIASSLDQARELISQAQQSDEHARLARECIGYEGPFALDKLFV